MTFFSRSMGLSDFFATEFYEKGFDEK